MPDRTARPRYAGAVLAVLALAACVPAARPPAAPAPPPRPAPPPQPAPPPPPRPAPPPADWATGPLSPGDWSYAASPATPAATFRSEEMSFALRCQQGRAILIGIVGVQADGLIVRTSFGERRLAAERVQADETVARLAVDDPLLEQMAFSRGRFLVRVDGGPSLVVPAWPELARVVEDCRGG